MSKRKEKKLKNKIIRTGTYKKVNVFFCVQKSMKFATRIELNNIITAKVKYSLEIL